MAKVSKNILIGYLKCKDLLIKWTNILDSFRHKDEKIPLSDLEETPKSYVKKGSNNVTITGDGTQATPYLVAVVSEQKIGTSDDIEDGYQLIKDNNKIIVFNKAPVVHLG